MNLADQLLQTALGDLVVIAGESVSLNGVTLTAVVSSAETSFNLMDGGHTVPRRVNVSIPRNRLRGITPVVGMTLLYGGDFYNVREIDDSPASVTLTCE